MLSLKIGFQSLLSRQNLHPSFIYPF
jgi:hypothetical protein